VRAAAVTAHAGMQQADCCDCARVRAAGAGQADRAGEARGTGEAQGAGRDGH
jgi:hypothetical protein